MSAGTGLSFGTATSKGGATVTVTSSATALGGLGAGYVPASQGVLPTIDTNSTGAFGGVFELNTGATAFTLGLDLNTLYGTDSSPTGGAAGKWFLGSATTATYTADALGASGDGNYRLGGGGGTLTLTPATPGTALLSGANNLVAHAAAIDGGGTVVLGGANTFTGSVWVNSGVLTVASLNRVAGGTASSSLGAPTTAANGTIAVGSAGFGATLRYTGAGETTDRVVNLAGTTGGATLDQSGTGLLKFTSA